MAINTPTSDIQIGALDPAAAGEASATQPKASHQKIVVDREQIITVLPYAIAAGLFVWLAYPTLHWWWWEYTRFESYYSHGPLIPFMSGFMLWHMRAKLQAVQKQPDMAALALIVPALALLVFAQKSNAGSLESFGLMFAIWGSVWLALGRAFMKAAWFPLVFLALMMPLPGPLLNDATLSLQMVSTKLAAKLLNILTFSNVQQGNLISMSNFVLFVDVPCSGFKTLLALFTFNAFLAAMLDGQVWRRVLLFAMCAPLAVVINGVRIALIGIVGECISRDAAHTFHDYSGMITLTLGFVVLFSLAKLLGCKKFAGLAIF